LFFGPAGPAVLVWCQFQDTGPVLAALTREADGWAAVRRAPFEPRGAYVTDLS